MILELGANDGLRGLPLAGTRDNLDADDHAGARARCGACCCSGMRMPPNYGERYTSGFAELYQQLATAHNLALVPFLLEGVALIPG